MESKVCTKCRETKPLDEYSLDAKGRLGRRARCKACHSSADKAHYDSNREKKLLQVKTRYEANREEINAYYRDRYQIKQDENLAYSKAYYAEKWANDPEYRAKREAATVRRRRMMSFAKSEPYVRDAIFERDGWICGICHNQINPQVRWPDTACASIDHIVPLFEGGDDTPENVQASHAFCNFSKNGKVPSHFRRAVAEAARNARRAKRDK